MRVRFHWLRLGLVVLALHGCASTPSADNAPHYLERARTQSDGSLTVTTAALSSLEGARAYGVALARQGMQAVWVEVENHTESAYWFLPQGLDPNFFPYWEAAAAFAVSEDDLLGRDLATRFEELALPSVVRPGEGEKVSGFVLTHLDEGIKVVQLNFLGDGRFSQFLFIVDVPGFIADYHQSESLATSSLAESAIRDFDQADEDFRAALAALPCCTVNSKGTKTGDPLNLVVVGGLEDALPALAGRGWRPTETTWRGSVTKMIVSGMSGEPYPYAPVSPLYLFGRPQDLALQKARDNIHQRNHLRLWRAPMRYQGKQVWIGQISRDIGTRLTIHSPYLTTHKIDPDVDQARRALTEDMVYSQFLQSFDLVEGVGASTPEHPGRNLTGDPFYTDGYRIVLVFDRTSTPINEIGRFHWVIDRALPGADGR